MDVRLSPEQVALKESARKLLGALAPSSVADLDDVGRAADLDAAVSSTGWRDLRFPEDDDGAPLASGVEAALVAEELGRAVADTPYLGPLLARDLARRAGVADERPMTIALTPDLGSLAGTREGPPVAVDAAGSAAAIVAAPVDGGFALGTLALSPSVVRSDQTRPIAGASPTAAVAPLDGARVVSHDDVAGWTAFALAVISADLVGTMRGALDLARDYAMIRTQYGATIGSFQAVQHLLADAHVAAEGSYSLALHAAWAADALPPEEALLAARHAKAYCSRAALEVCEIAIQVHGGIGNTWECLAHVYLRRALHSSDILGGTGASLAHVLAHHGIKAQHEINGGDDGLR